MIKSTAMLMDELNDYVNPTAKIRQLAERGELTRIIRGLYETDINIPGYYLAQVIYGPSYLSFEFALSYHSLIPEAVYTFTSATFEKKKKKRYDTPLGTFTYRDIPNSAYPYGVVLHTENNYGYQIASPEKAVCDELYKLSPVSNRKELQLLLFSDLRIDESEFFRLDVREVYNLSSLYNTRNHKILKSFIRRRL